MNNKNKLIVLSCSIILFISAIKNIIENEYLKKEINKKEKEIYILEQNNIDLNWQIGELENVCINSFDIHNN